MANMSAEYHREYYKKRNKQKIYKQKADRKKLLKAQLLEYLLLHPCVDCGESDPVVLEFDHVEEDEKETAISNAIGNGWSFNRILKEIEKCEVRCANCHRRRTAKQFNYTSRCKADILLIET